MESQEIRFCESADGVKIGYTVEGEGPPLLYIGVWTVSIDFPHNPAVTGLREGLAEQRTVVAYDRRGIGVSQREIGELTLEGAVSDVESVAGAAELDRFDLLGAYDGAHVALAYCARHAAKVRRLVLLAPTRSVAAVLRPTAGGLAGYIRSNWDSAVLAMAALAQRETTGEAVAYLADAYKRALSPDAALKYLSFIGALDSSGTLATISVPTLVVHWKDDPTVPLDEARAAAALIPDCRFVVTEGPGPPWRGAEAFLDPILEFLLEGEKEEQKRPGGLTEREAQILALLAAGRSNQEIAGELSISARTVERHIGNIYTKIGAHNRAEATSYAIRNGITWPPEPPA